MGQRVVYEGVIGGFYHKRDEADLGHGYLYRIHWNNKNYDV